MRISTYSIFCAFAVLYWIAIPLEVTMGIASTKYVNGLDISYAYLGVEPLCMALASLLALMLGLYLANTSRFDKEIYDLSPTQMDKCGWINELMLYLTFNVIAVLVFCWDSFSIAFTGYENAWAVNYSSSLYSLLMQNIMFACPIVLAGAIIKRRYAISVSVLTLQALIIAFTQDKDPLVLLIFGVLAGLRVFLKKITIPILALWFIVACVGIVYIKAFAYIQGGMDLIESMQTAYNSFDIITIDPAGPYYTFIETLLYNNNEKFNLSYFSDIGNILPKYLFPNRPITLPEKYATKNIIDYKEGMGLGFSPLTEFVHNFDSLFFVGGLFLGIFWIAAWKFFSYFSFNKNIFALTYLVVGSYQVIMIMRGTTLIFVKPVLLFLISLSLFNFVYKRFKFELR